MKRIHSIELKHFKAFRDTPPIELNGRNLLLYGPNGSGKSSIFWALHTFLQSSQKPQVEVQKYFDPKHRESLVNIDMGETMKTGKPYQTHLDPLLSPPSDGRDNSPPLVPNDNPANPNQPTGPRISIHRRASLLKAMTHAECR